MNKFIAILSFALSLYGCDVGGNTYVHRSSGAEGDVLHSRVVARPGFAEFECLRSASGHCHYTLYPRKCPAVPDSPSTAPQAEDCRTGPAKRFALASGERRRIASLSRFRLCVSTDPGGSIPGCAPPPAAAATQAGLAMQSP
ncbi:hypothetical protein [Luteimonas vadosa]|uniref:Lipoprotein n=1 Tax=Luteimonas vadosa TaxID=1165507 RepID=A0ABP9DTG1_9GAMM